MQRMVQRAVKEGDVQAARLVADRCLGKLGLDPLGDGIPVDVPPMTGFASVLRVTESILSAVRSREAPVEAGEKLLGLLSDARTLYETEVLQAVPDRFAPLSHSHFADARI